MKKKNTMKVSINDSDGNVLAYRVFDEALSDEDVARVSDEMKVEYETFTHTMSAKDAEGLEIAESWTWKDGIGWIKDVKLDD